MTCLHSRCYIKEDPGMLSSYNRVSDNNGATSQKSRSWSPWLPDVSGQLFEEEGMLRRGEHDCPKVLLSWNSNQLKSFPKWYIFSFSIWYVYYVLLWIKCGCMRFANCCILGVFILILTQSPNFFLTGFVEEAGWPKEREEWRGMKRGINCAETEMEIKTED